MALSIYWLMTWFNPSQKPRVSHWARWGRAFCGSGKAGNGDNLALHRAQDIARSDLGGRAAEPVAALAAAAAFYKAGFA